MITGLVMCEHIKENAVVHVHEMPGKFRGKHRIVDPKLRKRIVIALLRLRNLYKNIFRKLLLYDLHKAIIVLPEHHDVRIVVPRDKAMVADRSKQGTSCKKIPDVVFPADAVDLQQISEQYFLYLLQLAQIGIVKNKHLICMLQILYQDDQPILHGNLRLIAVMLNQLRIEHAPTLLWFFYRSHFSGSDTIFRLFPVLNLIDPALLWEVLIEENRQLSRRLIRILSFYVENFIFRTHREHKLDRREHIMDAHIGGTDCREHQWLLHFHCRIFCHRKRRVFFERKACAIHSSGTQNTAALPRCPRL